MQPQGNESGSMTQQRTALISVRPSCSAHAEDNLMLPETHQTYITNTEETLADLTMSMTQQVATIFLKDVITFDCYGQ